MGTPRRRGLSQRPTGSALRTRAARIGAWWAARCPAGVAPRQRQGHAGAHLDVDVNQTELEVSKKINQFGEANPGHFGVGIGHAGDDTGVDLATPRPIKSAARRP